jgi:hypothetical protein
MIGRAPAHILAMDRLQGCNEVAGVRIADDRLVMSLSGGERGRSRHDIGLRLGTEGDRQIAKLQRVFELVRREPATGSLKVQVRDRPNPDLPGKRNPRFVRFVCFCPE